ncbi:hypothetical protein C1646_747553 [Rhizophagus diaphanus]|nr:hypothetical protein C1646_747553 [Rhizophagus diaphanus] [Rhizophagus sp. MUCL 43196]
MSCIEAYVCLYSDQRTRKGMSHIIDLYYGNEKVKKHLVVMRLMKFMGKNYPTGLAKRVWNIVRNDGIPDDKKYLELELKEMRIWKCETFKKASLTAFENLCSLSEMKALVIDTEAWHEDTNANLRSLKCNVG